MSVRFLHTLRLAGILAGFSLAFSSAILTEVFAAAPVNGAVCSEVGTTTMNTDKTMIFGCLKQTASSVNGIWKPMGGISSLDCTIAEAKTVNGVAPALSIVSGNAAAVAVVGASIPPKPFFNNSRWGAKCLGEYKKTGCYMRNESSLHPDVSGKTVVDGANFPSYTITFYDTDIWNDGADACVADDEEADAQSILSIVCCRVLTQ